MSQSKDLNPSSLPVAIELQGSSPRRFFHKTSVPKQPLFETWMVSEETKEGDQEEDIIVSEDVVIFTQDSDLVDDIEMGG